ncbi:MAG: hypothetical protein JWM61_845 [Micrococcaceae bacterium]|jgi:hypothetical protein|nr:hypothetical protein [Micrococcaceae bacterium]
MVLYPADDRYERVPYREFAVESDLDAWTRAQGS